MFADDTALLFWGRSKEELQLKVQKNLDVFCEWLKQNKLVINIDKTVYMIFKKPSMNKII